MDRGRSSGLVVPGLTLPGDPEFEAWRKTHPPMAGGAGWSNSQAQSTFNASSAASIQLAFGSNVTAGQLVVAVEGLNTNGATTTFSDVSGNVTSWTTVLNNLHSGTGCAIGWGIATSTGACTPKAAPGQSVTGLELYIGSFDTPGGAVTQDGTTQDASVVGTTHMVTPAANGVGSNDLVVNYVQWSTNFTSFGGSWVGLGPVQNGDAAGYLINAAGNSTPDQTAPSGTANSTMVALQAIAPDAGQPFAREFPSTHFGPF